MGYRFRHNIDRIGVVEEAGTGADCFHIFNNAFRYVD